MKRHPANLIIWIATAIVLLIVIYVVGKLIVDARREVDLEEEPGATLESLKTAHSLPVKIETPIDSSKPAGE